MKDKKQNIIIILLIVIILILIAPGLLLATVYVSNMRNTPPPVNYSNDPPAPIQTASPESALLGMANAVTGKMMQGFMPFVTYDSQAKICKVEVIAEDFTRETAEKAFEGDEGASAEWMSAVDKAVPVQIKMQELATKMVDDPVSLTLYVCSYADMDDVLLRIEDGAITYNIMSDLSQEQSDQPAD